MTAQRDSQHELADGIAAALAAAGRGPVTVSDLSRLTGGASRESWAATVTGADGTSRVVLRRDPPGHGEPDRMTAEAACLRAAAAAGVPVPELLADGDGNRELDSPYLITGFVGGEALGRRIQRDPAYAELRPRLAAEMGRVLAGVHTADTAGLGMLDATDPLESIERLYRDLDDPRPVVETGLAWLRDHRPPARPAGLVHGDFRLGNLLIEPTGITAVLDWELSHLGDPIEDLGWLCVRAWRFGAEPPVAGIGEREQLLDGYAEVAGFRPDAAELHWWEVFGTLRWLVISQFQAHRHFVAGEGSLELAAIGRRVCESEYDLLLALGRLDPGVPPAPEPQAVTVEPVHDRPRTDEILELVGATLLTDIAAALPPEAGREKYLARICANLLSIAGRELARDDADDLAAAAAYAAAGVSSAAELAAGIGDGTLDPDAAAVAEAITVPVLARLQVANPRHFAAG